MIDYEIDIFNKVASAVETAFPGVFVSNRREIIPSQFPCAAIYETDNSTATRMNDSSNQENAADISYVVDVCSNLVTGSKEQCKAILAEADEVMRSINFNRVATVATQSPDNPMFYRMTAKYAATIGNGGKLYRR